MRYGINESRAGKLVWVDADGGIHFDTSVFSRYELALR